MSFFIHEKLNSMDYEDKNIYDEAQMILSTNNAKIDNISKLITDDIVFKKDVYITDTFWEDFEIEEYILNKCTLNCSKNYVKKFLNSPISDINELQKRQKSALQISPKIIQCLKKLKNYEADVLWLFSINDLNKSWPISTLFPSFYIINTINSIYPLLTAYHTYRGYCMPLMTIIGPLMTLFGPWFYLNKYLKYDITFQKYVSMIITLTKTLFSTLTLYKKIYMLVYLILIIHSIINSFEQAKIFRYITSDLNKKINNIHKFFNIYEYIINNTNCEIIKPYLPENVDLYEIINNKSLKNLNPGLCGIYEILTSMEQKTNINNMLIIINALQTCLITRKLITINKCCIPNFSNEEDTKIINMGHIKLNKQIRNPVSLDKSLIITGPNAAGKTTYVKSIGTNQILAQTFGVVLGTKAIIHPVQFIGSFMRINDILGDSSLFEAEIKRCSEIVEIATNIYKNKKNGLIFMDEPMHSTPPIEGSATTMALIEYITKMNSIKLVLTTHYHEVTKITETNNNIRNISMTAECNDGEFNFSYRIRNGPSYQSIALELLKHNNLPDELIKSAIELKNKICIQYINNDSP